MNPITFLGIFLVVWWTVLFAILPIGVTSYAEAGIKVTDGGDPGAPIDPKLGRKAFTTTWVTLVIMAVGYVIFRLHIIHIPNY